MVVVVVVLLFPDGDGALVERGGFVELALVLDEEGEVVQGPGDVGVVVAEELGGQFQGPFREVPGLRELPPAMEGRREVLEGRRQGRAGSSKALIFADREGFLEQGGGLLSVAAGLGRRGDVAEDRGVLLAVVAVGLGDDAQGLSEVAIGGGEVAGDEREGAAEVRSEPSLVVRVEAEADVRRIARRFNFPSQEDREVPADRVEGRRPLPRIGVRAPPRQPQDGVPTARPALRREHLLDALPPGILVLGHGGEPHLS
mmetsp:Transcript_5249/g.17218  ORF Transcript_5249/g.17218 Transcript_5249/m.17218 type:complete len:257 (-) Transcript_5249:785-1555(-)